jgi:hypothetical protein
MSTTAKAVIKLFVLANSERRTFFVVKRAAGLMITASLFKADTTVDQFNYVCASNNVINKLAGDTT